MIEALAILLVFMFLFAALALAIRYPVAVILAIGALIIYGSSL